MYFLNVKQMYNILIQFFEEEKKEKKEKDIKGISIENGQEAGEGYEKLPGHIKRLLKFEKIISKYPKQVIRYAYGGEPLWPIVPFQLNIPSCPCGLKRKFECQILPSSLVYLNVDKNIKVYNILYR